MTIAPRTAFGRSSNSGREEDRRREDEARGHERRQLRLGPGRLGRGGLGQARVGREAAEQAAGDVRGTQREQLLVGVDLVAVPARRIRGPRRPTRRPRGTRSRRLRGSARGSRRRAGSGGRSRAARSTTSPTTLTPLSCRWSTGTATSPSTSAISGPGIRLEIRRRTRISTSDTRPIASVYGSVFGISATSWRSWSGTEPLTDGTPSSLGSCPTTIVIARPKMNPVTTDFVRKSATKPSRRQAARRGGARRRSSPAPPSARGSSAGSPPARSTTTAADMIAIVELAVTLRWRLVPNIGVDRHRRERRREADLGRDARQPRVGERDRHHHDPRGQRGDQVGAQPGARIGPGPRRDRNIARDERSDPVREPCAVRGAVSRHSGLSPGATRPMDMGDRARPGQHSDAPGADGIAQIARSVGSTASSAGVDRGVRAGPDRLDASRGQAGGHPAPHLGLDLRARVRSGPTAEAERRAGRRQPDRPGVPGHVQELACEGFVLRQRRVRRRRTPRSRPRRRQPAMPSRSTVARA